MYYTTGLMLSLSQKSYNSKWITLNSYSIFASYTSLNYIIKFHKDVPSNAQAQREQHMKTMLFYTTVVHCQYSII